MPNLIIDNSSPLGATLDGVQSINGGPIAGMRNRIINGKMDIAQRGTAGSFGFSSTNYLLDRWCTSGAVSTAVATVTQAADAPSNNEFQSSLRVAVTAADTVAATKAATIHQHIEGYNARDLIGRTFTLSFWVRSSKTGVHCISLRNSGLDRAYVAEYTVMQANTWEREIITVPAGLITAGTWNWTNGTGLVVGFALMAGANFQTAAGAWQTGGAVATANQVNCLDTVGNIFAVTGVQLEVGTMATGFEHRPFGTELALCQRYYEKCSDYALLTPIAGILARPILPNKSVTMRSAPSVTVTHPATGAVNRVYEHSTTVELTVTTVAGTTGATQPSSFIQLSTTPTYSVYANVQYTAEL